MGARSRYVRFMLIGWIVTLGSMILLVACSHPTSLPTSTPAEPPLLQISGLSVNDYQVQTNVIVVVDRSKSMAVLWREWQEDIQEIFDEILWKSERFRLVLYPAVNTGGTIEIEEVSSLDEISLPIETSKQERNGYVDAVDAISKCLEVKARNIVIWITDGSFDCNIRTGERGADADSNGNVLKQKFYEVNREWSSIGYDVNIYLIRHIDDERRDAFDEDWRKWDNWKEDNWLSGVYTFTKNMDVGRFFPDNECLMQDIKVICNPSCRCEKQEGCNENNIAYNEEGDMLEIFVCKQLLLRIQWRVIRELQWEDRIGKTDVFKIDMQSDVIDLQDNDRTVWVGLLNGKSCATGIAEQYHERSANTDDDLREPMQRQMRENNCEEFERWCYRMEGLDTKDISNREVQFLMPVDIIEQCNPVLKLNWSNAKPSLIFSLDKLYNRRGK